MAVTALVTSVTVACTVTATMAAANTYTLTTGVAAELIASMTA